MTTKINSLGTQSSSLVLPNVKLESVFSCIHELAKLIADNKEFTKELRQKVLAALYDYKKTLAESDSFVISLSTLCEWLEHKKVLKPEEIFNLVRDIYFDLKNRSVKQVDVDPFVMYGPPPASWTEFAKKEGGGYAVDQLLTALTESAPQELTYAFHRIRTLAGVVAAGKDVTEELCQQSISALRNCELILENKDTTIRAPFEQLRTLLSAKKSLTSQENQLILRNCYAGLRTRFFAKAGAVEKITLAALDWLSPALGIPGYGSYMAGSKATQVTSPTLLAAYKVVFQLRERINNPHHALPPNSELIQIRTTLEAFLLTYSLDLEKRGIIANLIKILEPPGFSESLVAKRLCVESAYRCLLWERDMSRGFIEKGAEVVLATFKRFAEDWWKTNPNPPSPDKANELRRLILKELEPHYSKPKPQMQDKATALREQVSFLKVNASRLILTHLTCFLCGIDFREQSNLFSAHDPEGIFKEKIYDTIENTPIHPLRKLLVKTCFDNLAPMVSYYMNHFITNMTNSVTDWINLSPTKKFEHLQICLLSPSVKYVMALLHTHTILPNKLKKTSTVTDPSENFALEIDKIRNNNKEDFYLPTITHGIIKNILCHSPTLNWVQKTNHSCKKKIEGENDRFLKLYWRGWSNFFTTLEFVTFPIQAVTDKVTRLFLGQILERVFHALLNKKNTTEFYLNSIYKFLGEKLSKHNKELDPSQNDLSVAAETLRLIPLEIEDNLFRIIEILRQVITEQVRCSAAYRDYINKKEPTPEQFKIFFEKLTIQQVKPLIHSQILPLFYNMIQKNLLEETWLQSLTKLNEMFFIPPETAVATDEVDTGHYSQVKEELKEFFRRKIEGALDDFSKPYIRQQKIISQFLADFKNHIQTMATEWSSSSLASGAILARWSDMQLWLYKKSLFLEETLDADDYNNVNNLICQFREQSESISQGIQKLKQLSSDQTEAVSALKNLKELEEYLQKTLTAAVEPKALIPAIKTKLRPFSTSNPTWKALDDFKMHLNTIALTTDKTPQSSLQAAVNAFITKIQERTTEIVQPQSNALLTEIAGIINNIQRELASLRTWAEKQTLPNVEPKASLPLQATQKILDSPLAVSAASGILMERVNVVMNLFNKPYHYPLFLQFLLAGYLKIPPLPSKTYTTIG